LLAGADPETFQLPTTRQLQAASSAMARNGIYRSQGIEHRSHWERQYNPNLNQTFQEGGLFMEKTICSLILAFLGLFLSALAGAQSGPTLLVTTDMDCNWKLDGQPMDPLKADQAKVLPVSVGEHLIQAATTDEVTKIRIDAEVDQGQKTVEIQLKSEHDQELKRQQEETIRKQAEAEVHPTWTDPDTGLMWAKKDNGSDVSWNQASDYCTKLQLVGF
jgi:hypothetical protein